MAQRRILLTGANGFVGSHILDLLLKANYSIRAIVRSESKIAAIKHDFPSYPPSNLDFGIVPDMTSPGAFDAVILSSPPFDVVIHTASPFLYRAVSSNLEFLDPAIKGTTEILKAVKEHAPSVKRVVITSSCAAVVDFTAGVGNEEGEVRVYSEEDWNPVTWEQALNGALNVGYQASKKFAEIAAWDFIKTETPNFDLVTLCPPMVYGPLRHTLTSTKDLNQSNSLIYNNFIGGPNCSPSSPLPPNGMHVYVDVRDLAQAHILAATMPEAGGQRFVICAGQYCAQDICDILRGSIGELENRTPVGRKGVCSLPKGAVCPISHS